MEKNVLKGKPVINDNFIGYECCSAMYSSYCPECCGQTCIARKLKDKDKEKLCQEALNKVDNPMLVVNVKE